MDLKLVRTFIYVARLRSFSKAARALDMAQPAVSRQVQALEEDLRTPLLFRTTRGVEPTEAGALLLRMGEDLLAQVEQAREAVMRAPDRVRGEATLGMPPSLMPLFALPLIEQCRRVYPDLRLRVTEGLTIFLEEWLSLGRIDLAILSRREEDTLSISRTRLVQEGLVLVGAAELIGEGPESIAAAELLTLNLIITRGFRDLVDAVTGRAGLRLRYAFEMDSIPIIEEMISRGAHASILPSALVHKEGLRSRLSVRRIVDPPLLRELVIGANPGRPVTVAVRAVRGLIVQLARDIPFSVQDPVG